MSMSIYNAGLQGVILSHKYTTLPPKQPRVPGYGAGIHDGGMLCLGTAQLLSLQLKHIRYTQEGNKC